MSHIFGDRVRETSTTTGTGTYSLAGPVTGFQDFDAVCADSDTIFYFVELGADWEVGKGTFTSGSPDTLARTTILASSNAGSAVNWPAGVKNICGDVPASDYGNVVSASRTLNLTTAQQAIARSNTGAGVGDIAINATLAVSAAASALTIALKTAGGADPSATDPVLIGFRSATGTTGTPSQLLITAATSLVISSGSMLGVASSTAFRLWIVGFNDGGTFRLGVINCASSTQVFPLNEAIPTSSTAEGGAGAADSAGVFYTGTAVTTKAYRVLGYIEWSSSGLTAGTWTTSNLNYVQMFGPGIKLPGAIVQLASFTTASATTSSTTVITSTALTKSITPQSAANRILVQAGGTLSASTSNSNVTAQIYRDTSTAIGSLGQTYYFDNGGPTNSSMRAGQCLMAWDSPNQLTSTAYTVRIQSAGSSATGLWEGNSVITVQEIQG